MKPKRGRPSSGDLVLRAQKQHQLEIAPRPDAPYELNEEEARIWKGVVDRMPGDWFQAENYPLLVQYCRHVANSHKIANLIESVTNDKKAKTLDIRQYNALLRMQRTETAAISTLSMRMRLAQQATISQTDQRKGVGKRDWEVKKIK